MAKKKKKNHMEKPKSKHNQSNGSNPKKNRNAKKK